MARLKAKQISDLTSTIQGTDLSASGNFSSLTSFRIPRINANGGLSNSIVSDHQGGGGIDFIKIRGGVYQEFGNSAYFGSNAGDQDNQTDGRNVGIGYGALKSQTSGLDPFSGATIPSENVGIGYQALRDTTTGTNNVAVGNGVLSANTTGYNNVAFSKGALGSYLQNTTSVAIGYDAGQPFNSNTINPTTSLPSGGHVGNTMVGHQTFDDFNVVSNATVQNNTAIGFRALRGMGGAGTSYLENVSYNVGIGRQAGLNITPEATTDVTSNTFIGNNAGQGITPAPDSMDGNLILGSGAAQNQFLGDSNLILHSNTGDSAFGFDNSGVVRNGGKFHVADNIAIGGRANFYASDNIIISNAVGASPNTIGSINMSNTSNAKQNVILGGFNNIISPRLGGLDTNTNPTADTNTVINSSQITLNTGTDNNGANGTNAEDNFIASSQSLTLSGGTRNSVVGSSGTITLQGDENTMISSAGISSINGDNNTIVSATQGTTIYGDDNMVLRSIAINIGESGANEKSNENVFINSSSIDMFGLSDGNTIIGSSNQNTGLEVFKGNNNILLGSTGFSVGDLINTADNNFIANAGNPNIDGDGNSVIGGINTTVSGDENVVLETAGGTIAGNNNIVSGVSNTVASSAKYSFVMGQSHDLTKSGSGLIQRNTAIGYNHSITGGNNGFIGGSDGTISGGGNSIGFGKGLEVQHNNTAVFGKFNEQTPSAYQSASGSQYSTLFQIGCGFNTSSSGRKNAMSVVAQPTGNSAIVYLDSIVGKNYADDSAAATAGIGIGGLYHSNGFLKVRIGGSVTTTTTTTTTTRSTNEEELEEQR